ENVARGQDQVLLTRVLDLGAAVLAVQHRVADLDVQRDALLAVVVEPTGTHCQDFALLRLLLGGVRDNQPGGRRLLGVERLDDDAVLERLDGDRHLLTSPSGLSRWLRTAGRRPSSRGRSCPACIGTLTGRVPTRI